MTEIADAMETLSTIKLDFDFNQMRYKGFWSGEKYHSLDRDEESLPAWLGNHEQNCPIRSEQKETKCPLKNPEAKQGF